MTKADFKRAEKELLATLATLMPQYGFSPKAVGQSFYREVEGGRWALHVSFIRHQADFDITADVAVRLHAVEDLVNQHTDAKDSEKRASFTLGAELGQISGGPPLRFSVTEESDIPAAAQAIAGAFARIGMPYLRRVSDLRSACALLSSTDPSDWFHCPIQGARCMRALAAAHILGDHTEVARLITECEARLSSQDEPYLPEFRRLATAVS